MNLFSTGKFGDLADSQRLARVSLFTSLVLMTMVLVLTWSRETDNATVVVNDLWPSHGFMSCSACRKVLSSAMPQFIVLSSRSS